MIFKYNWLCDDVNVDDEALHRSRVSHCVPRQQRVACSDAESPEIGCSLNGPSHEDGSFTRVHACMHTR